MGSSSPNRGEHKKSLKPPPRSSFMLGIFQRSSFLRKFGSMGCRGCFLHRWDAKVSLIPMAKWDLKTRYKWGEITPLRGEIEITPVIIRWLRPFIVAITPFITARGSHFAQPCCNMQCWFCLTHITLRKNHVPTRCWKYLYLPNPPSKWADKERKGPVMFFLLAGFERNLHSCRSPGFSRSHWWIWMHPSRAPTPSGTFQKLKDLSKPQPFSSRFPTGL